MDYKQVGYQLIDEYSKELFDLSSYLHQNPEISYKEYKAHDYICNFLETKGFQVFIFKHLFN